jgi:hypothetical protein
MGGAGEKEGGQDGLETDQFAVEKTGQSQNHSQPAGAQNQQYCQSKKFVIFVVIPA